MGPQYPQQREREGTGLKHTVLNKPALGFLVFLRDQKDSSSQDQESVFVPQAESNSLHY